MDKIETKLPALYKGLILECNDDHIIVISTDREFYKLKYSAQHSVGQQIYFFEDDVIADSHLPLEKTPNKFIGKKIQRLALLAAIFALIFVSISQLSTRSAALMSIDINPSISLELDHEGRVLKIHEINNDAEKLLKDRDLKGYTYGHALDVIVKLAKQQGYSLKNKNVLIGIAPLSAEGNALVQEIISDLKAYKANYQLEVLTGNTTDAKSALTENSSLGKSLYQINHLDEDDDSDMPNFENDTDVEDFDERDDTEKINKKDDINGTDQTNEADELDETDEADELDEADETEAIYMQDQSDDKTDDD